jgi:hypothetical protein
MQRAAVGLTTSAAGTCLCPRGVGQVLIREHADQGSVVCRGALVSCPSARGRPRDVHFGAAYCSYGPGARAPQTHAQ